jgi:glucan biosynthesis protein C
MIVTAGGSKSTGGQLVPLVRDLNDMLRPLSMSRSSLALDNLRAVVIIIVLAFHSVLAYVQWFPLRTSAFDDPPYAWRITPLVDTHRWFVLDLICAWQDVYLMSLMFLLSGLFVWQSLERKRSWGFVACPGWAFLLCSVLSFSFRWPSIPRT